MRFRNTSDQYGIIAMLLHWIMAVLFIGMVIVGLYMTHIPVSLLKLKLYDWHKEFGILILMLAMVRIVWRLNNIRSSLTELPWWEAFAARAVHWAFYGFMFALPITGWLMTSAAGLAPSFFGLFVLPNLVAPDHGLKKLFETVHQWLAYGLIAAFCAHVGAALKHHWIDRDGILRRMLP
jgi:cytochrome b561